MTRSRLVGYALAAAAFMFLFVQAVFAKDIALSTSFDPARALYDAIDKVLAVDYMRLLLSINPLYSLSGFVVGFLVGMTGVGGGSLMTPLLILMFGIHPSTAVGTDLLYASATKTGGTVVHGYHGTIDWRVVGRLALGSVPATALTLLVLAQLGVQDEAARKLITTVLGCALLSTAVILVLRHRIVAVYGPRLAALDPRTIRRLTIITGAVLGVLVSISSVGAGALGVTALILLYPELPIVRIVGSDIAHAVPLTLIAGSGHWWLGSVDWPLFGSLLVGSLPGIVLGSFTSIRVPDTILRYFLAAILAMVAAKLLL